MKHRNLLSAAVIAALAGAALLAGCSSSSTTQAQASSSSESGTEAVQEDAAQAEETEEAGGVLGQILEKGEIVVGTEGTYSPYSYHDENDDLVGYDVEVARAIADKLGVEAVFAETEWDAIIAGLDAKKFDIIINQVSITPEREEKYLFSTPYTYAYGVVITTGDNDSIQSFEDLDGKSAAQTQNSNWAGIVESYGGKIVGTGGFSESIQLVMQGRADATVNDSVTFLDFKKSQPDADVKIAAESEESTQSAALIRKEDGAELQEAVNKALAELQEEGTLAEISNKYFGGDVSAAS